jgi:hypothetical protein
MLQKRQNPLCDFTQKQWTGGSKWNGYTEHILREVWLGWRHIQKRKSGPERTSRASEWRLLIIATEKHKVLSD